MNKIIILLISSTLVGFWGCRNSANDLNWLEKKITSDMKNHDLDDNDNFSPDNNWLVYDTRDEKGIGANPAIEKVDVETGEMVEIYRVPNQHDYGPGCGAASYHPRANKVIFIHGLMNCSEDNPYRQWRRFGMIIDENQPEKPVVMDARDLTAPHTPGALAGGTHRHEWSADGQWIGFTYNDAILADIENRTGEKVNLRTLGVAQHIGAVKPDHSRPGENFPGAWYAALIVQVVPLPVPGSDEIIRAAGDRWLGEKGYQKADGQFQRARTFLGTVIAENGKPVQEVFVVDLPDRIDGAGAKIAIPGSNLFIPQGLRQRRLTHTANWPQPGVSRVSSSPDGMLITFVAKDPAGIEQIFAIAPHRGKIRQLTNLKTGVAYAGGIRWRPDGSAISFVEEGTIKLWRRIDGRIDSLTRASASEPMNLCWSHDGRRLAFNRIVESTAGAFKQIFLLQFNQ